MDVKIPGVPEVISGTNPIVIIGPNGIGQTRLGVAITQKNGGERVAALRNVEIPEIPLQRFDQASQNVKNALTEVLNQHWRQSFELQNLMSQILAEDRELAVKYRDTRENNPDLKPDEGLTNTRLRRIVSIPGDVIAEVLGAASFSISASRLIFCEGDPDSLDTPILSAWHNCPKTAVVAVGSCESVRQCVCVFRTNQATTGLDAFGYVDRDAWPDVHLGADQYVKAHAVSEIEGLFCLEPVFKALAKYNGPDDAEANSQFDNFVAEARDQFKGVTFNKEVLVRNRQ